MRKNNKYVFKTENNFVGEKTTQFAKALMKSMSASDVRQSEMSFQKVEEDFSFKHLFD